jgi:DNA modification methylase
MSVLLVQGDARAIPLADASVHLCCTSPPYWGLRSYGIGAAHGELGGEPLHDCLAWARQEPPREACCWICAMRAVFAEVHRVLRNDGTLWINVGDSYARSGPAPPRRDHSMGQGLGTYGQQGYSAASAMPARAPGPLPEKNLLGLPWRLALALQQDGFLLRSEIIWAKKNCMPESVQDRVVRAHEQIFLFSKAPRYYFDMEAIREKVGEPTRRNLAFRGVSVYKDHVADGVSNHAPSPEGQSFRGAPSLAGRACRSVWFLASEPFSGSHFATFPTELVRKCLLAGAPRQVCSACGKAWVRDNQREKSYTLQHGYSSMHQVQTRIAEGSIQQGSAEERRTQADLQNLRSSCGTDALSGQRGGNPSTGQNLSQHTCGGHRCQEKTVSEYATGQSHNGAGQETMEQQASESSAHACEISTVSKDTTGTAEWQDTEQSQACTPDASTRNFYDRGLEQNARSPEASMLPLSQEVHQSTPSDDRSHHSTEQGRSTQPGKHRRRVSSVQFQEVESSHLSTLEGWHPTCACNAPPRRSVILDPFAGSGTVGLVARELGHDAVCLDLSYPYLSTIARERLGLADLHRWTHGAAARVLRFDDLPLFAEAPS